MSLDTDFVFENFEEYFGNKDEVITKIDTCNICGSKMSYSHLSDFKNLLVQETSRCPECGHKNKKKIHVIM